jgi:hypothetical protein
VKSSLFRQVGGQEQCAVASLGSIVVGTLATTIAIGKAPEASAGLMREADAR